MFNFQIQSIHWVQRMFPRHDDSPGSRSNLFTGSNECSHGTMIVQGPDPVYSLGPTDVPTARCSQIGQRMFPRHDDSPGSRSSLFTGSNGCSHGTMIVQGPDPVYSLGPTDGYMRYIKKHIFLEKKKTTYFRPSNFASESDRIVLSWLLKKCRNSRLSPFGFVSDNTSWRTYSSSCWEQTSSICSWSTGRTPSMIALISPSNCCVSMRGY